MAEKPSESAVRKLLAKLHTERLDFTAGDVPSFAATLAGFVTGRFKSMADVREAAKQNSKARRQKRSEPRKGLLSAQSE